MSEIEKSDFGKGFTYCLGLFLAHERELCREEEITQKNPQLNYTHVLYGACDHLFDLVTPDSLSQELKDRTNILKDKGLEWRLPFKFTPTVEEQRAVARELFSEAKSILLAYDLELGTPAIKGDYE